MCYVCAACSHVVGLADGLIKKKNVDFPKKSCIKEAKTLSSCLLCWFMSRKLSVNNVKMESSFGKSHLRFLS